MDKIILVGLGGAVGAMFRYAISLLPWKGTFPILTLITNLLGALLIGMIVGIATQRTNMNSNLILFLKTGVCGGFTTFSTFSLEALELFEKGQRTAGILYIALSIVGCVMGVWIGKKVISGVVV